MMTYDERQEIEVYIGIIEKNCKRLERSIDMLKDKLDEYKCVLAKNEDDSE